MTVAETTTDTMAALLESALERTEDSEVHFKLRTALQLVDVLEAQHEQARETLEEADIDSELRERLRELGYVE